MHLSHTTGRRGNNGFLVLVFFSSSSFLSFTAPPLIPVQGVNRPAESHSATYNLLPSSGIAGNADMQSAHDYPSQKTLASAPRGSTCREGWGGGGYCKLPLQGGNSNCEKGRQVVSTLGLVAVCAGERGQSPAVVRGPGVTPLTGQGSR